MTAQQSTYRYEQQLVDEFCVALQTETSPWGHVCITREFGYASGRTDVVAVDHSDIVVAFEAKLLRWREAIHQAYRNSCYAHLSYVILPAAAAKAVERHSKEFVWRGVGLCYAQEGNIVISIPAIPHTPIQSWLSTTAVVQARKYDL